MKKAMKARILSLNIVSFSIIKIEILHKRTIITKNKIVTRNLFTYIKKYYIIYRMHKES